jgi:hypothetical protein
MTFWETGNIFSLPGAIPIILASVGETTLENSTTLPLEVRSDYFFVRVIIFSISTTAVSLNECYVSALLA